MTVFKRFVETYYEGYPAAAKIFGDATLEKIFYGADRYILDERVLDLIDETKSDIALVELQQHFLAGVNIWMEHPVRGGTEAYAQGYRWTAVHAFNTAENELALYGVLYGGKGGVGFKLLDVLVIADIGKAAGLSIPWTGYAPLAMDQLPPDFNSQVAYDWGACMLDMIGSLLFILGAEHSPATSAGHHERVAPSLTRWGKPFTVKKLPYTYICLAREESQHYERASDGAIRRKLHSVRGHFRRYEDGKVSWIKSHWRGSSGVGVSQRLAYRVKG